MASPSFETFWAISSLGPARAVIKRKSFSYLNQDHVKLIKVGFFFLEDFWIGARFDDQPNNVLFDAFALVPWQDLPSGLDHALEDLESVILRLLIVGKLQNCVHL
jgi:hypothetical protein